MYTTGAAYPGIMANQYAPASAYAQQGDRSHLLANLRRPSVPSAMPQQYPSAVPSSGYAGQQQGMYDYQPSALEMEIARMQLQNLELQKQLLLQAADAARMQHQQQGQGQPAGPIRRERQSTQPDGHRQHQMQRDWRSPSPQPEEGEGHARRDALQTLDRAQRQRHASANSGIPLEGGVGGGRGSRLSFGGGIDLIEHAKARHRHSASIEPPVSPVSTMAPPLMSTPPPPQSVPAFATPSPPRPTLVLSKPGEAYPVTSPSPPPAARGAGRGHRKSGSHSSSASSSGGSDGSEPHSFESAATSVGNQSLKEAAVKAQLNPSAAAFTPSCVVAPPVMLPASPPRPVVTPFRATRLPGTGGNGGQRPGVVVIRQPRAPCDDEELPAKNFASRIRRRAIGVVRRGRNSYIAPEEVVETE